ncbi:hypothetical protein KIPB_005680, partial [Kipferlia bialata]
VRVTTKGTDYTKEQIAWIIDHIKLGNRLLRPLSEEEQQALTLRVLEDGLVGSDVWNRYNRALSNTIEKYGMASGEKGIAFTKELWWGTVFREIKEEVLSAFKQVCPYANASMSASD